MWADVNEKANDWPLSETKRHHRPSLKNIVLKVGLALLLTAALFHRPIAYCIRRVTAHCSRTWSVEQRAHRILKATPLIGET